jgi:hypothetical protein
MIIHLVVPKQRLIAISPKEILDPNVLIWELDFLFGKRSMDAVIVMFGIQFICIQQREDDGGTGNATQVSTFTDSREILKGYFSPEVYC